MAHRPMYCSNTDGDDCTKHDGIVSIFVCFSMDEARGLNEGEVFLILGRSFCPSFILAYIKAQNREKFDPARRLFLLSLPLA